MDVQEQQIMHKTIRTGEFCHFIIILSVRL
jgi:hypothetical protein